MQKIRAMIIHFSINFRTTWGQNLYISGSLPELGGGDPSKAVAMNYSPDNFWKADIKIASLQERLLSYKYLVRSDDGSSFYEAGAKRTLGLNSASRELFLNDEWQGNSGTAPFLTAPFSDIFFSHGDREATQTHIHSREVTIRVTAPAVGTDWVLGICGDSPLLGSWNPAKAPDMIPVHGSRWVVHLPAEKLGRRLEFKFIKRNPRNQATIWEERDNRVLELPGNIMPHQTWAVEYSQAAFSTGTPRFSGTAVPVFSIRTADSCGIGSFTDLKTMGDWLHSIGQNVLQILPVNDTTSTGTWTDSYPYGGISVMALHPIFIDITAIGPLKNPGQRSAFTRERKALDALPAVDYEKVLAFKNKYLRIQFGTYKEDTFAEPKFLSFYRSNRSWLLPYCAFCALRDSHGTADFSQWGEDSVCTPELIARVNSEDSPLYPEISFHIFTQYHLHRQLLDSVQYLHSLGIALKGDIPIGITRNSADAWASPELFHMDSQAGAPPDDFAADGQNWGFPTYDWDRMASDGYRWWKERFRHMSGYFDAYRIDHVLGFFRIWEIPACHTQGTMGHFSPALPMSCGELRSFGFPFDFHRHATPYIRYWQLKDMFGDRTQEVMDRYLNSTEYDVFTLKEEFSTQKKIADFFGPARDNIKDGLLALVSEVLFLEDCNRPGMFHPRISAQHTRSYRDLPEEEKAAYNRIYDHFFYKRHNEFWRESALRKLPEVIAATNMLTCAEDLGMIPECVPGVLHDLRILSLEIFRMSKDPASAFGDPARYPYMSVCTTGTHDTSTLRQWWEEERTASSGYWRSMMHGTGEPPCFCEPWICERIIRSHMASPSMLAILPLQDWLSVDGDVRAQAPSSERINIPSVPKHYWRYRMHLTVEELMSNTKLTAKLQELSRR